MTFIYIIDTMSVNASADKHSASASIEAGQKVEYSPVDGVNMEASSGFFSDNKITVDKDGLTAETSTQYGTKVEISAEGNITDKTTGFGIGGSATATMQSGAFVDASVEAGKHGVAVEGGASIGESAGIEATATGRNRYTEGTVGAGVSVGEQLEIGGGGEATYKDGKLTIGMSGDIAALVGVEVDVKQTVDVGQAIHDTVHVANHVADISKDAGKVINNTAKDTGKAISNGAKSTGKKVKKAFKF
jgi:hypothetical protein